MIQIIKSDEIIAVLNFDRGEYSIIYLKQDRNIETWFSLFSAGESFDIDLQRMVPYAKQIDILTKRASLEYQNYRFKVLAIGK